VLLRRRLPNLRLESSRSSESDSSFLWRTHQRPTEYRPRYGADMMRFALKFRPLRPGTGGGGGGGTPVGSGSGVGGSVRRQFAVFCRRIWNDGGGGGGARCCSGNSLRDRLNPYRFRRSACQTGCTRAFLIVLNFAFLVSRFLFSIYSQTFRIC